MKVMHTVWSWLMAVGGLLYREDHDDYIRLVEAKKDLAERIAISDDPIRQRISGGGLRR